VLQDEYAICYSKLQMKPGGFRVSTHLAFVSKYLSLRSAKRLSASFCARVVPRDSPPKTN
jgi:hypothetical protein